MRKAETQAQGSGAVQMVTAVMLGGLLALGVELTVLLLGAAAVSNGILKEDSAAQVTAAACVVGGLAGGLLACSRWSSRRLIAGLAVGIVCCLLGDGFQPGPQALIELAGCLCGGAAAGLLSGRKTGKKRVSARKK